MSATRDKSQKISFVYSNFYKVFKTQPDLQPQGQKENPVGFHVLKTEQVQQVNPEVQATTPVVTEYRPTEFLAKRIRKDSSTAYRSTVDSLKNNLGRLQDLQSRLNFMLKEIEELSKK